MMKLWIKYGHWVISTIVLITVAYTTFAFTIPYVKCKFDGGLAVRTNIGYECITEDKQRETN